LSIIQGAFSRARRAKPTSRFATFSSLYVLRVSEHKAAHRITRAMREQHGGGRGVHWQRGLSVEQVLREQAARDGHHAAQPPVAAELPRHAHRHRAAVGEPCSDAKVANRTAQGLARRGLGRWTSRKRSRQTCSPRYGLQSWRRESAGVAISHPKSLQCRFATFIHRRPTFPWSTHAPCRGQAHRANGCASTPSRACAAPPPARPLPPA
jgi:hypothetical protein